MVGSKNDICYNLRSLLSVNTDQGDKWVSVPIMCYVKKWQPFEAQLVFPQELLFPFQASFKPFHGRELFLDSGPRGANMYSHVIIYVSSGTFDMMVICFPSMAFIEILVKFSTGA